MRATQILSPFNELVYKTADIFYFNSGFPELFVGMVSGAWEKYEDNKIYK